jgi:hypothetical protein
LKANYRSFNMRFNTLPAVDLGNLSTNSTDLGFLKLVICALRTLHPEFPIKKSEI